MLFYATVKNIEIIGEAAYHLTKAFCKEHPQTPWNDVMRMRNILVHDYYKIRLNEVWKVIQEDLQPLAIKLSVIWPKPIGTSGRGMRWSSWSLPSTKTSSRPLAA